MLYQETDSRPSETLRPSKLGSQTQESGGMGRVVAVISQCVSSLHGHSSRQGPEHTHDHHSPSLPKSVWGTLEVTLQRSSASLLPLLLLMPFTAPLQAGSDLCRGALPLLLGSWQGCGEGGAQLRRRKLGTKCCSCGGCFPRSKASRSLSLGQPSMATTEPVTLE